MGLEMMFWAVLFLAHQVCDLVGDGSDFLIETELGHHNTCLLIAYLRAH